MELEKRGAGVEPELLRCLLERAGVPGRELGISVRGIAAVVGFSV